MSQSTIYEIQDESGNSICEEWSRDKAIQSASEYFESFDFDENDCLLIETDSDGDEVSREEIVIYGGDEHALPFTSTESYYGCPRRI